MWEALELVRAGYSVTSAAQTALVNRNALYQALMREREATAASDRCPTCRRLMPRRKALPEALPEALPDASQPAFLRRQAE
jgi:hypothetical protein